MSEHDIIMRIRDEAERQGLSGRALSAAMGLPNTTVRHMLYDLDVPLTVGRLLDVARALGKPAAEIAPELARADLRRVLAEPTGLHGLTVGEMLAMARQAQVAPVALIPALGG